MAIIHERFKHAAKVGFKVELRALLMAPGCDALVKDANGLSALMWAARHGHEACFGLLLPASDALAKNNNGLTASGWAASCGHESLVRFMDTYAWAQSQQVAPRRRAVRWGSAWTGYPKGVSRGYNKARFNRG